MKHIPGMVVCFLLAACTAAIDPGLPEDVDGFMAAYETEFQRLSTEWSLASWASLILEGDTTNVGRTHTLPEL